MERTTSTETETPCQRDVLQYRDGSLGSMARGCPHETSKTYHHHRRRRRDRSGSGSRSLPVMRYCPRRGPPGSGVLELTRGLGDPHLGFKFDVAREENLLRFMNGLKHNLAKLACSSTTP